MKDAEAVGKISEVPDPSVGKPGPKKDAVPKSDPADVMTPAPEPATTSATAPAPAPAPAPTDPRTSTSIFGQLALRLPKQNARSRISFSSRGANN